MAVYEGAAPRWQCNPDAASAEKVAESTYNNEKTLFEDRLLPWLKKKLTSIAVLENLNLMREFVMSWNRSYEK